MKRINISLKKVAAIAFLLIWTASLTGCPLDGFIDRIKGFEV